jgi:hypothetical protein
VAGDANKPKERFPIAVQRLELLLDMFVWSLSDRLGCGQQALENLTLINLEVDASQQT